jgi:hypothetical protein
VTNTLKAQQCKTAPASKLKRYMCIEKSYPPFLNKMLTSR